MNTVIEEKKVNVVSAAVDCRKFIECSKAPKSNSEFSKDHLYKMVEKIQNGHVSGEKAHRWLGWLQCAVVVFEGATFSEMKLINSSRVEKPTNEG
tara:strand:+ start:4049 stop:4333 length:285 start_codon:yes stop_codon:yes gene_type:complete